jgi:hypothetical protein
MANHISALIAVRDRSHERPLVTSFFSGRPGKQKRLLVEETPHGFAVLGGACGQGLGLRFGAQHVLQATANSSRMAGSSALRLLGLSKVMVATWSVTSN